MIPELDQYDIPFTDIEQKMIDWTKEALALRHEAGEDPEGSLNEHFPVDSPEAILATLMRVNQRAFRVDALMAKITQARGRSRRVKAQSEFEAQRAYDLAMRNNASKRSADSFISAKEKDSDANLEAFEQKRIAHQSGRVVSISEECHEVITQVHWQLEGMRRDLRGMLHALQFDSSLER